MIKDDITFQLGQRWAAALQKRYNQKNAAKAIAKDFDIEVRTAWAWLYGSTPYLKYVWLAAQRFGCDFLAEILTPNVEWEKMVNIDNTLLELEKKICQLRHEIASGRKDVK